MKQNQRLVYACSQCKIRYGDKEIAEKCEKWCKKYNSCNLNIIKHAIRKKEHSR